MFNKGGRRKFRGKKKAKPVRDDDDEDDAPAPSVVAAQKARDKARARAKTKNAGKAARLSFQADELSGDGSVPNRKPVNRSLKTKQSKRSHSALVSGASAAQTSSGAYSADALRALQADSFQFGAAPVALPSPEEEQAPAWAPEEPMGMPADEAMLPPPARIGGGMPYNHMPYNEPADSADIPDELRIQRAKAKREEMRRRGVGATTAGGSAEFIPLDPSDKSTTTRGVTGRLQRGDFDEDDDMGASFGEEDLGGSKMALSAGVTPRTARTHDMFTALRAQQTETPDDELSRWEADRIRRATGHSVSRGGAYGTPQGSLNLSGGFSAQVRRESGSDFNETSVTQVCKGLEATLSRLQETHGVHDRELSQNMEAIRVGQQEIDELQAKFDDLGPKYTFYQDLWNYVRNQVACMDQKAVDIEECEEQILDQEILRFEGYFKRRWLDIEDMALEVSGESAATSKELAPSLDDMGRDRNWSARAAAEQRTQQRRQRLEGKTPAATTEPSYYTWGAEAEKEEEVARAAADRRDIATAAKLIFSDTDEQFYQIGQMKQMLEKWKFQQSTSYHDAYVALNLPKLFAPIVRLELLQWAPDLPNGSPLEAFLEMSWFQELESYGASDSTEMEADDPDANLVPRLVEAVVLPRVIRWLTAAWDPLSTASTAHAVTCVEELLSWVEPDRPGMVELLAAVVQRLHATAAKLRAPTVPSTQSKPDRVAAWCAAQLFSVCATFVECAAKWHAHLTHGALEKVLVDIVANQLCAQLACPRTTPEAAQRIAKLELVVDALPPAWLTSTETLKAVLARAVGEEEARHQGAGAGAAPAHTRKLAALARRVGVAPRAAPSARYADNRGQGQTGGLGFSGASAGLGFSSSSSSSSGAAKGGGMSFVSSSAGGLGSYKTAKPSRDWSTD